jgi:hypothetical protein
LHHVHNSMSVIWKKVRLSPNLDASEWLIFIEYSIENGPTFPVELQLEVQVSVRNFSFVFAMDLIHYHGLIKWVEDIAVNNSQSYSM